MKAIRDEIKKLVLEIFVLVDEKVAIDNKIKKLEYQKENFYNLTEDMKYDLLNKILRGSIFKNFNGIYLTKRPQYSTNAQHFHFEGKMFYIGWNGCIGANTRNIRKYIQENGTFTDVEDTVFENANVQEFTKYVSKNYSIIDNKISRLKYKIDTTDLYDNYFLAIQFLLCSTKYFPKEIRYIIANKILFFASHASSFFCFFIINNKKQIKN